MASHIRLLAETDGSVSNSDVREGLSGLDVSVSSPLDSDGRQVSTVWDGDDVVLQAGDGEAGSFTKKSESALVSAIETVGGVTDVSVEEGGYEQPSDTDDESDATGE